MNAQRAAPGKKGGGRRQVGASLLCPTHRGQGPFLFMCAREDLSMSNKAAVIFSPRPPSLITRRPGICTRTFVRRGAARGFN